MVEQGVLLSYEARHADAAARMAEQLDKILRGTPAGDIPFELPATFRVAINLRSARRLGFTVPPAVLLRVDKVYE
jgi:putative ABC transport system substrate-binding protein